MKPWLWRVAVPPAAFLLGWSAARLCPPAPRPVPPKAAVSIQLQPFLTPPLRHGGCQGPLWLPNRNPPASRPSRETPSWTAKP